MHFHLFEFNCGILAQKFESVGHKKGSLAIVAAGVGVERKDLIAVSEIKKDLVSCGFYDVDFGFDCLERLDSEPMLFSENEIKILGKIIGVGYEKNEDGKMEIKLLKL